MSMTSNLSDRDTAEIQRMYAGFSKAVVNRDGTALLAWYTNDAIAMPPHYPAVQGHAAIRTWIESMPPISRINFVVEEIVGSGDLAIVRGTYTMSLTVPGVPHPVDDRGKYIEIRKRQPDGTWPMWRDIFNSDLAAGS